MGCEKIEESGVLGLGTGKNGLLSNDGEAEAEAGLRRGQQETRRSPW